MLTDDKITELFCMADDFCKFFLTSKWENTVSVMSASAVTTVTAGCQSPKVC